MKILVTGSGGLVGFETVKFFLEKKANIIGIDNNMRNYFFGKKGDTKKNIEYLRKLSNKFKNIKEDIRNRKKIINIFKKEGPFDLIVHTAAQPSHDWAMKEPFTDYDINAVGTLNLLEAFRLNSPKGVFIHMSTNKVYGDKPNNTKLKELKTRYEFKLDKKKPGISKKGINEEMSIDNSTHSIYGASKLSSDIIAQEYGKYFKLKVGVFRGGCITGPQHSAVELHGFLSYIIKCAINKKPYTIFGYKGKQVRDQIHSKDLVKAFYEFYKKPKKGEVYNIGGGKNNSASILEIINILDKEYGYKLNYTYNKDNRIGDHICYYSDNSKFQKDYPKWKITTPIRKIIEEIISSAK